MAPSCLVRPLAALSQCRFGGWRPLYPVPKVGQGYHPCSLASLSPECHLSPPRGPNYAPGGLRRVPQESQSLQPPAGPWYAHSLQTSLLQGEPGNTGPPGENGVDGAPGPKVPRCAQLRPMPPSWGHVALPPFALLTGELREDVGSGVWFCGPSEAGPRGGHGFG